MEGGRNNSAPSLCPIVTETGSAPETTSLRCRECYIPDAHSLTEGLYHAPLEFKEFKVYHCTLTFCHASGLSMSLSCVTADDLITLPGSSALIM